MIDSVKEQGVAVVKKLRKPGKHAFWAWIAYQTVKGTLTTTFIWIPLVYAWMHTS